MPLKEELESMLTQDRKRLEEVKKQLASVTQEKVELERTIESAETLLSRKFGIHFNEANKNIPKDESPEMAIIYKSIPDGAFQVISEGDNKPLHVKEIYRILTGKGKEISQPSSIGVALRRDKRFKLIGPNVFAITDEYYKK